jgi:TolA-binding protein
MQTRGQAYKNDNGARIQELEKRIRELEQKVELVTAHSNELEEQTREAFSKVMKLVTRLASATVQFNESVVLDAEERATLAEEEEDN